MNIEHYKSKNDELARSCNTIKDLYKKECLLNNKLREELVDVNKENMQLRVFMVKQMAKSMDMMMLGFENKSGNYHHKLDVNGFLERLIRYLSVESADSESFLEQTVHSIREAGRAIDASLIAVEKSTVVNNAPPNPNNSSSSTSELSLPVDDSVSSCESVQQDYDDALPRIIEEDSRVDSERGNELSSVFAPAQIETSTPYDARKSTSSAEFRQPQISLKRKSISELQRAHTRADSKSTSSNSSSSSSTVNESRSSFENLTVSQSIRECFVSLKHLEESDVNQILKDKSAKLNMQKQRIAKAIAKKSLKKERVVAEPIVSTRPKRAATPTNLSEMKINRKMRRD